MDIDALARHAQRISAGLPAQALPMVRAHVYRAELDFEALAAVERAYVQGAPPPNPPEGSWLAFVFAKPSLEDGTVHVHALEVTHAAGERELWLKLKRAEALVDVLPAARPEVHAGAAIHAFVFAGCDLEDLEFGDDLLTRDGPAWLRTEIAYARSGARTVVRAPVVTTPLDAPPRFAGMHYVKLRLPKR